MTDKLKQLPPAILTLDDKSYSLPTLIGAEGEKAIDISKLRSQSHYVTLDEGYGNTASCESAITYIDGEKGILRYRGYPIEELAEHSRFVEVAYLLLNGELPNSQQLLEFSTNLNESSIIHEDMHHFFNGFPRGSHPMGNFGDHGGVVIHVLPDSRPARCGDGTTDRYQLDLPGAHYRGFFLQEIDRRTAGLSVLQA